MSEQSTIEAAKFLGENQESALKFMRGDASVIDHLDLSDGEIEQLRSGATVAREGEEESEVAGFVDPTWRNVYDEEGYDTGGTTPTLGINISFNILGQRFGVGL